MEYTHIIWKNQNKYNKCSKCGELLYSYACAYENYIQCLVYHLACKKCEPDPQGFGKDKVLPPWESLSEEQKQQVRKKIKDNYGIPPYAP